MPRVVRAVEQLAIGGSDRTGGARSGDGRTGREWLIGVRGRRAGFGEFFFGETFGVGLLFERSAGQQRGLDVTQRRQEAGHNNIPFSDATADRCRLTVFESGQNVGHVFNVPVCLRFEHVGNVLHDFQRLLHRQHFDFLVAPSHGVLRVEVAQKLAGVVVRLRRRQFAPFGRQR